MEKNLRFLIGSIRSTLEELEQVSNSKKVAFSQGKRGEYQSLRLRSSYLKKKLFSLKESLGKKIRGNYIEAKFSLIRGEQKETFIQTFTDLTKDEVESILSLEAKLNGCDLLILEIKEIITHIRKL